MSVFKLTTIIIALISSFFAFAGSMGATCPPGLVSIECREPSWHIAADALYLEPTSSTPGFTYTPYIKASTGAIQTYPNPWSWGFRLQGAGDYRKGSDININWSHFAPFSQQTYFNNAGTEVSATRDPRWDAVNIELGQRISFNTNRHMRLHGGFEYARVVNTSTFTNTGILDTVKINQTSTYNGFGPRLGVNLDYQYQYGLGVYAEGVTGLLAGTSQFNRYDVATFSSGGFLSTLNDAATINLVPELEARLGATYDYLLSEQGHVMFNLGWLWVNYFNAQTALSTNRVDVFNGDFGLQGLFFGLTWSGNAI